MDRVYTINKGQTKHAFGDVKNAADVVAVIEKHLINMKSGFAVCWLYHAVLIGSVKDGTLNFHQGVLPDYPRDLLQLRLFDSGQEMFIWRDGSGSFRFRLRQDGTGSELEYVDAEQLLCGTRGMPLGNGWIELSEDRGVRLVIPVGEEYVPHQDYEFAGRYALITRNYIDYNEIGQAGYVDCRFTAIAKEK